MRVVAAARRCSVRQNRQRRKVRYQGKTGRAESIEIGERYREIARVCVWWLKVKVKVSTKRVTNDGSVG